MPALYTCPILRTERLTDSVYRLTLHAPPISRQAHPGQFINIRVRDGYEPLWRRPLSVHAVERRSGAVQLLYAVVGRGTRLLSEKKPGDSLNVLGPLGNSFTQPDAGSDAILVAGGLGIAPLHFLARELLRRGAGVKMLLGAKSRDLLLCAQELRNGGVELLLATEDGSEGYRGVVTGLLMEVLRGYGGGMRASIYACGPIPMLRLVSGICRDHHLPAQASLETLMACGFGACMGCAVPATPPSSGAGRYRLTCVDGPVFNMAEVHLGD